MNAGRDDVALAYLAGGSVVFIGSIIWNGVKFLRAYRNGYSIMDDKTGEEIIMSSECGAFFAGCKKDIKENIFACIVSPLFLYYGVYNVVSYAIQQSNNQTLIYTKKN